MKHLEQIPFPNEQQSSSLLSHARRSPIKSCATFYGTFKYLAICNSAATLWIIPAPAVLYIMARSIDQGKKAGIVSVLGVLFSVLAGVIWVSVILMTSATSFNIVKYLGAAYLIYLGCKAFFSTYDRTNSEIPKAPHKKLLKIFYESVLVEVMDPKTELFF